VNDKELKTFVGLKIKKYRKLKGWTQQQLAEKLNVSTSAITNYENATRSPMQDNLFKLADIFGVSVDAFFPESETTPQTEHPEKHAPIDLQEIVKNANWDEWLSSGGKPLSEKDKLMLAAMFGEKLDD
jgi:transcriptional regulator with XRE-family HTH domain